jgi:hypothetical protein
MSIRYLVPEPVVQYIEKNQLYTDGQGTLQDGQAT